MAQRLWPGHSRAPEVLLEFVTHRVSLLGDQPSHHEEGFEDQANKVTKAVSYTKVWRDGHCLIVSHLRGSCWLGKLLLTTSTRL